MLLCELAAEQGKLVDMHCDASDDPLSRHIETLTFETNRLSLHVAQMTSQAAMRQCFQAVTANPAKILQLEGYGLEAGCNADFVLLQAQDPIEAIRLRATRLQVYRRGQLLAQTPATPVRLQLPGRPAQTDWMLRPSI